MKHEKTRKVFLDELPRGGLNRGNRINWQEAVNNKTKVKFIYDNLEGEIEIIEYILESQKLIIKYNDKEFNISMCSFLKCAFGKILGRHTSDFKVEIGQIFKDKKRDLVITDRKYKIRYKKDGSKCNEKHYKYTCNKCGWTEGWAEESNLRKNGCSCCSGDTIVYSINTIVDTDPWMVKYFQGGYEEAKLYTKAGGGNPNNKNGKIYPICPDCGTVKRKLINIYTIYTNNSIGCSCGDGISYPNKFMFNALKQLQIDFETEYSPEWVGRKRYDFYIQSMNLIIEMDGEFHKKDNFMNGQTKEGTKFIDYEKDRIAKENGIEVIRIDCYYGHKNKLNFIKNNILNSKLNDLFDFSNIYWDKSNEFALSNRVKEACELKRNNPNMTTTDIGKIMTHDRHTISKWLKQGNELGWCVYCPKEEMRKIYTNQKEINKKYRSKPIICIETGQIFDSAYECARQSLEMFGVKMDSRNISSVCLNKQKFHKHFHFKFILDLTPKECIKYSKNTEGLDI